MYRFKYIFSASLTAMTTAELKGPKSSRHAEVIPVTEARKEISTILKGFTEGTDIEPVYIGAHRKAEAVLISISAWEEVLNRLDEIEIEKIIRERRDGSFIRIPADEFAATMRKHIKENS
jgi:PHD/YefM family antitoxin component YafN of YafNO toxin-antitoxin module